MPDTSNMRTAYIVACRVCRRRSRQPDERNGRRLRFHPSGMTRFEVPGLKLPAMGQWRAIEPTATLAVARAPDFGEPVRAWRSLQVMIAETVEEVA